MGGSLFSKPFSDPLWFDSVSKTSFLLQDAEEGSTEEQYAAVSRKNIERLYIRRSLLETLVDSPDFERIVLGAFVRIKTMAIDNPSKAAYRLVPVIGKTASLNRNFCNVWSLVS